MTDFWEQVRPFLSVERGAVVVQALILLVVGFVMAKLVSRAVGRMAHRRFDTQQAVLLRRGTFYVILILFVAAALHQLGFSLAVPLGAAGVFSVAIGFASQTSASNLISGLFLLAERPFSIGDTVQVGGTTGEVLSIDLLSVKLRTFDNVFVRIPNESLIKAEVKTLTKFPIRRVDLSITVAYKEDIDRVRELLYEVAQANPLSLEEPKPLFIFKGFGDSAIELQFSPWATRENYLALKNSIQEEIKKAFDDGGIEIPFHQVSLHAGSQSEPLSIRLTEGPVDAASSDLADRPNREGG